MRGCGIGDAGNARERSVLRDRDRPRIIAGSPGNSYSGNPNLIMESIGLPFFGVLVDVIYDSQI